MTVRGMCGVVAVACQPGRSTANTCMLLVRTCRTQALLLYLASFTVSPDLLLVGVPAAARVSPAADFLQPDEVTFAVLLRGYGSQSPPAWQSIDTVLTTMKNTYGIEPTASKWQRASRSGLWGAPPQLPAWHGHANELVGTCTGRGANIDLYMQRSHCDCWCCWW